MTIKAIDPNNLEFQGNEDSDGILYVKAYPELLQTNAGVEDLRKLAGVQDFQQNKVFELQQLNTSDFKNTLGKISALLDDILKYQDSNEPNNQKSPISSKGLSKGFSLEEIEINLGVEAGAQFFVTAKGNAGLTLKYKRVK